MAKSLKAKVTRVLRDAMGKNATVKIEVVEPDRVGGVVLSRSFAMQSPSERQDHMWKALEEHLDVSERARVVFIVADTPEEYEALKRAAS